MQGCAPPESIWPPLQIIRLLEDPGIQANRLSSSPFASLLSEDERKDWLAPTEIRAKDGGRRHLDLRTADGGGHLGREDLQK